MVWTRRHRGSLRGPLVLLAVLFLTATLLPSPGGGTFTGGPVRLSLGLTAGNYTVWFNETGLSPGTNWSVNLGGSLNYSTGASIAFVVPNGSYNYSVGAVPGFVTSNGAGNVNVTGQNVSVGIAWAGPFYPVEFRETGLSTGTSWSVNLGGTIRSGTTSTIEFNETNGSYSYAVASIPSYRLVANAAGTVNVAGGGGPPPVGVQFDRLYTVYFNETGLPSGTSWSVTLNGTTQTSTSSSVSFLEINGSYAYQVGAIPGFVATPSSGSVAVAGADVSVGVVWATNVYTVTFTEVGLPAGTNWSIDLGGSVRSELAGSSPSTISFSEPNGSYHYAAGIVPGYAATNSSGSFAVNGANVGFLLDWTTVVYPVSFVETGLLTGTHWSVTLNGVVNQGVSSSGPSAIVFDEVNGTYAFTVAQVTSYALVANGSGTVVVAGGSVQRGVLFEQLYTLSFTEAGLPSGTSWSINLSGTVKSSTSPTISFEETNGSYPFQVGGIANYSATPSSGSLHVQGSSISTAITWSLRTYLVTVQENGLPTGLPLSVHATSLLYTGSGNTTTPLAATLELRNGSYTLSFGVVPGYHADFNGTTTARFQVSGVPVALSATFVLTTYLAVFEENGTHGLNWSVTVRNSSGSQVAYNWSFAATISFSLLNGSYTYSVQAPPQHTANYTPSFTIAGGGSTQTVYFDTVLYNLTFSETGLPSGATWYIVLDNSLVESTTAASFTFLVKNGGHNYTIRSPPDYAAKPASGSVYIRDLNLTVTVGFSPVTYLVTFYESGLPAGAAWGVEVNSTWHYGTGTSLSTTLLNGSYSFAYSTVAGYRPNITGGIVVVQGSPVQRLSLWSPVVYLLTFIESGLPGPADWALTFDGVTYSPNDTVFSLEVANGTYPFSVSAIGTFVGTPASGWVTLSGRAVSLTIVFSRPLSTLQTLEKYLPYGLIGLAALVGVVLLLAFRRRKKTTPVPPVSPPESAVTGAPPRGGAGPTGPPATLRAPWSEDEGEVLAHLQQKIRTLSERIQAESPAGERGAALAAELRLARELLRSHRLEDAGRLLDQIERQLGSVPG